MAGTVGGVYFERHNGSAYVRVCQVQGISGFGETNELVDATTFCSNGSREYIGGLADGEEMTLTMVFENDSVLAAMRTDVRNKTNKNGRLVVDAGSPSLIFTFAYTPLGWVLNPSVEDVNRIDYTLKISGTITES